jgi:hypothetical protein
VSPAGWSATGASVVEGLAPRRSSVAATCDAPPPRLKCNRCDMSKVRSAHLKRPTASQRRRPKPDRRRALELLASCPDGATDTLLMAAHGLTTEMLVDLIRDGLATGQTEHLVIAGHATEIMRVRITDAGRKMLSK